MAGDARLMDADHFDDVVDLSLAVPERVEDMAAGGIGQGLEAVCLHEHAYVL